VRVTMAGAAGMVLFISRGKPNQLVHCTRISFPVMVRGMRAVNAITWVTKSPSAEGSRLAVQAATHWWLPVRATGKVPSERDTSNSNNRLASLGPVTVASHLENNCRLASSETTPRVKCGRVVSESNSNTG
jgi:hypothetical protein